MAEHAKKLDDVDNYYVIKGRFRGADSNTFGLFVVFFSLAQKNIDNVMIAASHYSAIYDTPPATSWNDIEERINRLKWKGDVAMNTSQDLQLLLSNSIKPDMAEELIEAIEHNKTNKIDHTLVAIFEKGISDKSVVLDFLTQKVSHSDILKIKDERARKEKEETESKEREVARKVEEDRFKVEDGAAVLPVSLVLAPASGIPIYEVKSKDLIMIKIEAVTEKSNYFVDLLKARNQDGEIVPIKGSVKEVFVNTMGEYELLIEIGPGMYGKTVESERVKIKLYDAREDMIKVPGGKTSPFHGVEKEDMAFGKGMGKKNKDFFIWVVGGITFLLAMLILYLLFSGLL